ncbi:MAG: VRR-NUC domain-containing protein [Verrucomicrobiota bacterium]
MTITTGDHDAVTDESDLHNQILAECRRRLWPVVHSRMDCATTTARGCPDFVIFANHSRAFLVECKSIGGKLTTEQLGWQAMLRRNGHLLFVVRSFTEFLDVAEKHGIHIKPATGPA